MIPGYPLWAFHDCKFTIVRSIYESWLIPPLSFFLLLFGEVYVCVYFAGVAYFYSFFKEFNECSKEITLRLLMLGAGRPIHNHALVSIADLPGSTWFKTARCYAGTLRPHGFRSVSGWAGPKRASTFFIRPVWSNVSYFNVALQHSFLFS